MIDQREIDLLRSLLRSSEGTPLTDLKDQISGDAAVLQAVIEGLERDGYRFDKTGQSIRLLSEPDAVRSQSIAARLTTETSGRENYVFREATSTEHLAVGAAMGRAGRRGGVFEDCLAAGRRSRGRTRWSQRERRLG